MSMKRGKDGGGAGFFYPPIFQIAPSSVTFGASYGLRWLRIGLNRTVPRTVRPSRGSLRAMLRCGFCYGSFLHKPHRVCQSPSPGGEGGPALRAGSDEGEPGGLHSVGNRRTNPSRRVPPHCPARRAGLPMSGPQAAQQSFFTAKVQCCALGKISSKERSRRREFLRRDLCRVIAEAAWPR